MEQVYKDYRIEVSLSLSTEADGWFVRLFIYYDEEGTNILITFSLDKKFTTYDSGVEAGFAAAQEWIDRGKPALE